jgi:hypothetical protein
VNPSLCWELKVLVLDAAFQMPEKDDVMGISFLCSDFPVGSNWRWKAPG